MNGKGDEVKKTVKNQLFNAAVTGGSFEDFSQNAILFPVQEAPARTSSNVNTFMEFPTTSIGIPPPPPSTIQETVINRKQQEVPLQPYQDQPDKSHLSSVFTSFSNILTIGGTQTSNPPSTIDQPTPTTFENITVPAGSVQESVPLLSSNSSDGNENQANPLLPLFSTNLNVLKPVSPSQGIGNNLYRRSGSKKPTYAQIPGLLSQNNSVTSEFPGIPSNTVLQSSSSLSFLNPTNSSVGALEVSIGQSKSPLQTSTADYFQPTFSGHISPISSSGFPPTASPVISGHSVSSSILQPEDPSTLLEITNSSHFDQSNLTNVNTVFCSDSSSSSAILKPAVSDSQIPFSTSTRPLLTSVIKTIPEVKMSQSASNPSLFQGSSSNPNELQSPMNTSGLISNIYRPVYHHWFFKKIVEGRTIWKPFSMLDSLALEEAFTSTNISPNTVVATDGGRYDVNILRRERFPVYWTSPPTEVRRCSWFHKGSMEGRFIPYEENIATMLENEFRTAYETNEWHRKVELPNGDTIVFHGPDVLVLFPPSQTSTDVWGNTPQTQPRPRVVKRGMDEFDIDEGEPATVDHLLFIVHGIGAVCDLKFRSVEEVVDEFRNISLQLIQSHYRSSSDNRVVNRIEVLPVSWHSKLHSEDTGIDKNLKNITLKSIPRLRDFTNDTLLDILFYTSPMYCQSVSTNSCDSDSDDNDSQNRNSSVTYSTRVPFQQTIITTVGTELNRIHGLFKHRNPSFQGGVSLGGHSLGSLILFDLLSHQHPEPETKKEEKSDSGDDVITPLKKPHPKDRRLSRRISYMMSEAGTGQPQLKYPHLTFQPIAFFALGSPIGMFITVRGLDKLGSDFALPTCPAFFNIFHPYDPVAYRIESLINPELASLPPVLIPHHKGRKRMHLELKETMARVSADLKQKVIDSMKNTWNTFFQMTVFGKQSTTSSSLEAEVEKVFEEQLAEEEAKEQTATAFFEEEQKTDIYLGILNKGRRIDYVLQEAPFESFNEYLFALTSHVCYWESEDTMLLILKEIYGSMGITVDNQTMTGEKRCPSPKLGSSEQVSTSQWSPPKVVGMNPTLPMTSNTKIGPPPTTGFVRK